MANATKIGQSTKDIRKEKKNPLNSPLNRTYISDLANGMISALPLEQYFKDLDSAILDTHFSPCYNDGYDAEVLKTKETAEDKVRYILERRFEKLKDAMKQELDVLYKS